MRPLCEFVIDGGPESGGATAAGDAARPSYSDRAELFEGLVNRAAADVAMEEIADLFSGKAVFRSLKSLEDAIGDGVSDAGAEEGGGGVGTVVPHGEGRLKVRQADEGAAVESGVDGAEAQHLCFAATGGGAVKASAVLAQGCVVAVPEFACGRVAAKEDFGLALCPLDGAPEAGRDGG